MKNLIYFFFLFIIISSVASCTCNKQERDDQNAITDSLSYIHVDDADTFYSDWSKENILVCQNVGEPDALHPTNGVLAERFLIFNLIHGFIVSYDLEKLGVRPDLVKSLPVISENGLEYIYELRDEPRWDDGTQLTVDDVIFTFKANKCQLTDNPSFRSFLENLADIQKVADHPREFKVMMKEKYINNIFLFTDFPVIQKKIFDPTDVLEKYTFSQLDDADFLKKEHKEIEAWADGFNKEENGRDPEKISGMGPYKLESWEKGQRIVLVKKKDHWSLNATDSSVFRNAFPEKIIFVLNTDANSQMLEFKAQTYDVSGTLTTKTLQELQKDNDFNRNYHSAFVPTFNYTYLAMNMKPDGTDHQDFFSDKKVRRAIALLTPVEDIMKLIDKGKSKRVLGPVSPLKKDFNSDLKYLTYDIEKAKLLLDSAGWKDSDGDNIRDQMINGKKVQFEFELMYMNAVPDWEDIAKLIKESLYKAGISAELKPLSFELVVEKLQSHDFDAALGVWGGNSLPEDFTQLWHTSSWISNGSNYTGFGNASTDALIDSIKYEVDDAKRMILVKRFQKIVYDEQPYVFIKSGVRKIAIHKRFGNADMYYEKPGVLLNNLKLLYGTSGVVIKNVTAP
jgi:peptide/nickel transport system substrate-binding protein